MRVRFRSGILAVLLSFAMPTSAAAVTLHDSTGLSASAPAGYRLSQHRGVYRIAGHGLTLLYARVRAAGATPAVVGAELARAIKRKPSGVRSSATGWSASVGARFLEVRRNGQDLAVFAFSSASGRVAQVASAASNRSTLQKIADSLRGGTRAQLPQSIPMRLFTASDGGSSALVPDLPGWTFNGGAGVIEGIGPQGAFVFGFPFLISRPGTTWSSYYPSAPFPSSAEQGLQTVVPLELQRLNLAFSDVSIRARFDGSQRLLGPQWLADFMAATFRGSNGTPGAGVFLYGAGNYDTGVDGTYANYLSYALVRQGTDPRIGAALLRSWASWNPSPNQQQRLHDAVNSILTTNVGSGAIDPKVFDEAAAKWDAYFRDTKG